MCSGVFRNTSPLVKSFLKYSACLPSYMFLHAVCATDSVQGILPPRRFCVQFQNLYVTTTDGQLLAVSMGVSPPGRVLRQLRTEVSLTPLSVIAHPPVAIRRSGCISQVARPAQATTGTYLLLGIRFSMSKKDALPGSNERAS